MSFINPSDMVDEDAADLQFPKENDVISVLPSELTKHTTQYYVPKSLCTSSEINFTDKCCSCKAHIQEPYICCAECSSLLCLQCFAKGAETQYHRNTHSYIIRHDNVQVFPFTTWNASEEKLLLDLVSSFGHGNWDDIAKGMRTRSPDECRDHYHSCYFDGLFRKVLGLTNEVYSPHRIPYIYKMKSVDPPRHDIDAIDFKNMAGYRCARGDFDTPYDNSAESIVSHLDLVEWPKSYKNIGDELHCAIFQAYNHRIADRKRRYKIMKEHGLLMASKTLGWLSKYSEALGQSQVSGKFAITGRFIAFMQVTQGMQFDSLVLSLQHFYDLKKYLFKLYDLRSNGIRTFIGGRIYQKLKNKRLSKVKNKKIEQYENLFDWRNLLPNMSQSGNGLGGFNVNMIIGNTQPRRKAAPLEILGLPDYDKLSDDERNLCSQSRLVPAAYLEYKNTLMSENSKFGYLRLADARRLIKIDVNKTRQIYDFLLTHGFINKPFQN